MPDYTAWTLVPCLRVPHAEAAIAFYQWAFGAELVTEMPGPTAS